MHFKYIRMGVIQSVMFAGMIIALTGGCGHHQAMLEERTESIRVVIEEAME